MKNVNRGIISIKERPSFESSFSRLILARSGPISLVSKDEGTGLIGYVVAIPGVSLQNCTAGPFASGNGGGASRQRLLELPHGLEALRHYNDLANHVLSLNQQGAVVTKLLGEYLVP